MQNRKPKANSRGNHRLSVFEFLETRRLLAGHPSVADVSPANLSTNIAPDAFVSCDVSLVGVGQVVDGTSVKKAGDVTLIRVSDGVSISGDANTTGGGDAIIFTPSQPLDANTEYRFNVTAGVKDTAGNTFTPFTSLFTTGVAQPPPPTNIRFDRIPLPSAVGKQFTCVAVGPDHRLYVADQTGYIIRYDILDDGTLGASKVINTVRVANNNPRLITGIVFGGSKKHPTLYISHGYSAVLNSPDNTGKISKLSGVNLDSYQDLVVNLPRSFKDHLTDQLAWGPDGALYWCQPSMTAMGAADPTWGMRNEHLLSGTILRLDLSKLSTKLDARTPDAGGTFNPFAAGSPLTIYADGVRNSYDLIWTKDGHLFAATNGSAGGGNTPAGAAPYNGTRIDAATNGPYTGPAVPARTNVSSQPDYLYNIVQGGYYGHPNPLRDEFVMNGGNPTSGKDRGEVTEYPVGTQPDRNYRGYIFSFGQHESADGGLEYHGDAFGGALDGQLLYTQYSGGDNIIALKHNGSTITSAVQNIVGFTGFVDPLDISEDNTNGNIYVAEYGGEKIELLRPDETALASTAKVSADQSTLYYNAVQGGSASSSQIIIVKNSGSQPLTISQMTLLGDDPGDFTITSKAAIPIKLPAGGTTAVLVAYKPKSSSTVGIHTATLRIKSNDPNKPDFNVNLRGYTTAGQGGANEPSLQHLMDLYQIPITVGDDNPNDSTLPVPPQSPNDEVVAQTLVRADTSKPVTFDPLAAFTQDGAPVALIGAYSTINGATAPMFNILPGSNQAVKVKIDGTQTYYPGKNPFGLYVTAPFYDHTAYSEDSKNTFSLSSPQKGRALRFYKLKNADGTVVANAYVVAVDEESGTPDQQDEVFIVRNVKPVVTAPILTPPAAPTKLHVTTSAGAVGLAWTAAKGAVGYVVQRSTNGKTNFIQVNANLVTTTSFADNGVGRKRYYYRVYSQSAAGVLSKTAPSVIVDVTAGTSQPVPAFTLTSIDIGNPTPGGSVQQLDDTSYNMVAGGADVQGTSDQFQYAYQSMKGDFDVKVRVASLTQADVWSKAGIMARKTLDADARNIYLITSPTRYRMTYRVNPGEATTAAGTGTATYPNNWLRLARVGNHFTGYSSTDGINWTEISSVTMNMGPIIYVGLAATSHNTTASTTAQFRDLA